MSLFLFILGAISQGLLWSVMAIGVFISFRILNFSDLTSEGSFALGGSITAVFIASYDMNPIASLIIVVLGGMAAGAATGLLHTKLEIPPILSGILTMIGLYSINLVIMGQSNTALLGKKTIVTMVKDILPDAKTLGMKDSTLQNVVGIGIGIVVVLLVICFLYWLLGTELGCVIRATGSNEAMVRAQGVSTDKMKIIGLMLGNGLIALSGGLVAQSQGYGDVGMGVGAIVIGLASIVIGEVVMHKARSFFHKLLAIVLGSIIYRIIIALVLQLGLNTDYLKLLTAIMVAIALAFPVVKKKTLKAAKGGK